MLVFATSFVSKLTPTKLENKFSKENSKRKSFLIFKNILLKNILMIITINKRVEEIIIRYFFIIPPNNLMHYLKYNDIVYHQQLNNMNYHQ